MENVFLLASSQQYRRNPSGCFSQCTAVSGYGKTGWKCVTGKLPGTGIETGHWIKYRTGKEQGQAFLSEYGYRALSSLGTYLPFTASVSILFFQVLGWIQYGFWLKEENTRTERFSPLPDI